MGFDKREYNRAYNQEMYQWCKAHDICAHCHKNATEPHRTLCADCAARQVERNQKLFAALPEAQQQARLNQAAARVSQLKKRRIEHGECIRCGKKVAKGKKHCTECLLKIRRRNRARYDAKRVKTDFHEGLCNRCNEPALPGKMLCKKHYDIALRNIEKGKHLNQERGTTAEHVWRGDNKICFQQQKKRPVGGNRQGAQMNNISP